MEVPFTELGNTGRTWAGARVGYGHCGYVGFEVLVGHGGGDV